jgi:hypothetical protein
VESDIDPDDFADLTPHPKELAEFARQPISPGELDVHMVSYRAAMTSYYQATFPVYSRVIPVEDHMTEDEYVVSEVLKHLRRKVGAATEHMATSAGIHGRDLSHWLVEQNGFPWRDNCTYEDLIGLYGFAIDPANIEAARGAPAVPSIFEKARRAEEQRRAECRP